MDLKIKIPKVTSIDFWAGLVVISSIALRNYQYLLYVIQILFILFFMIPLLKKVNKKYVLLKGIFLTIAIVSMAWSYNSKAV